MSNCKIFCISPSRIQSHFFCIQDLQLLCCLSVNVVKFLITSAIFLDEHLDKVATKIIAGLENVENRLAEKDIRFLHVDVNEVQDISISSVPSLVYFKSGEPVTYDGNFLNILEWCVFHLYNDSLANLMNEDSIVRWAEEEYKTNSDVIEDVSTDQVKNMIKKYDYVLVFACKIFK